eukprot:SAG11_NODE_2248_length_3635_cov_6.053167_1_plen_121_part_00
MAHPKHNYAEMALGAVAALSGEQVAPTGRASFDNIAREVRARHTQLRYSKQLLRNALDKLERTGKVYKRSVRTHRVGAAIEIYEPIHKTVVKRQVSSANLCSASICNGIPNGYNGVASDE